MDEDKTKLEILYDHYKDTFQYQMKHIDNRNRYFFYSLLLIATLFFQISYPDVAEDIVRRITQKQVDKDFTLDFSIVNSLFIFGLLWVLILYFQTNITIDKYFNYIHKMEEDLSNQIAPLEITREGKFYKSNRPIVSKCIGVIYRIVYPFCILLAVITKIIFDWRFVKENSIEILIVNTLICLAIIITNFLFFVWSNHKFFKRFRAFSQITK